MGVWPGGDCHCNAAAIPRPADPSYSPVSMTDAQHQPRQCDGADGLGSRREGRRRSCCVVAAVLAKRPVLHLRLAGGRRRVQRRAQRRGRIAAAYNERKHYPGCREGEGGKGGGGAWEHEQSSARCEDREEGTCRGRAVQAARLHSAAGATWRRRPQVQCYRQRTRAWGSPASRRHDRAFARVCVGVGRGRVRCG